MVEGSLFFIVNQIEELAKFTSGIGRLEGFQSKVESISQTKPISNQKTKNWGIIIHTSKTIYVIRFFKGTIMLSHRS